MADSLPYPCSSCKVDGARFWNFLKLGKKSTTAIFLSWMMLGVLSTCKACVRIDGAIPVTQTSHLSTADAANLSNFCYYSSCSLFSSHIFPHHPALTRSQLASVKPTVMQWHANISIQQGGANQHSFMKCHPLRKVETPERMQH